MVDIRKYKREIVRRRENLLSGVTGHCFIEGDKIIKIYKNPKYEDNVCDLSGFFSSRISFPIEYIKKRRFYYGEVLPYFDKYNIMEGINYSLSFDKLMFDYNVMVSEIKKFPYMMMYDISCPNILYGNDGFSLIDVTNWKYDSLRYSQDECFRFNLGDFNDSLFYCLWKQCTTLDYDDIFIKRYLGIEFYNEYLNCVKGLMDFNKIVEIYYNMMKKYDFVVNNIDDMKKSVKILKKNIDFSK